VTLPVVHHPSDHPYTRRLPGRRTSTPVWKPGALAGQGIRIVHLHFGFETLEPRDVSSWIAELRAHNIRLVYTAHDLDNPHLIDQRGHRRLLELVVGAADRVLTLTGRAAAELTSLGATVTVVPHPHVVPLRRMVCRHHRSRGALYVHAATCRPNLDVELLVSVAARLAPVAGLRVHIRSPLDDRRGELATRLGSIPGVALDLSARLDDAALWDRIDRASAVLLPYRWGTHSGLLEAGRDLATPVLATPISTLIDQGATALDPQDPIGSLERCRGLPSTSIVERLMQRRHVVAAHRRMYRELLGAA
jgi:hypothetical protein